MRWTIQQLLANSATGIEIDRHVDVSELTERDKELIAISKAHVTGNVEVENEHAHFHMAVQGTMTLPDSNTLAETDVPFDITMVESFRMDGLEPPGDDETVHAPENGYVDVLPYIKEHILLAIPMRVINTEKKEGPAPQAGTGWNVVDVEEKEDSDAKDNVDPRLADLAKFFRDED
ncbi:YceD family protein [Salicibibacter kimchii]|uniref:YceD family protein n=1 Tax=Salicibibacter kimchii TaxID=2099786 RepID=UPI00135A26E4|nr:YceD family protein [Salicibibacter kimchii]